MDVYGKVQVAFICFGVAKKHPAYRCRYQRLRCSPGYQSLDLNHPKYGGPEERRTKHSP